MADQYRIFNRMYNYDGGYGHGTREKIHDLVANRFEQSFYPPDELYAKIANDHAGQYVTTLGLQSRLQRDFAMDAVNPQEKLPEDMVSAKLINTVPSFGWTYPPDVTLPQDYKEHDQVKLYQNAFFNSYRQQNLYSDPQFYKDYLDPENPDSKNDPVDNGMTSNQVYSSKQSSNFDGSAAGRISNHLGGEKRDESYRENSVETMSAF